jgi:VWFA-related protein
VTFRADTNLVLVRFQVVARTKDFVADLRPDEIALRVDGAPQEIALFEGGKLYPRVSDIEVHLVFDCSGSVQQAGVLNPRAFSANLLDEFQNVRIAIWGFSGKSLVYGTAPTRDPARLNAAMEAVRGMKQGATPLYRSLTEVAGRVASAAGDSVRMIVVVSDGLDDSAKGDAERTARSAGISVFPVLVDVGAQVVPPQYLGSPALDGILERANARHAAFIGLADATGGRAFEFQGKSPDDLLDQILKRMAAEIRYDYVVGYYAPSTAKRGLRQVQVTLKNPSRGRVVGGVRDVQH